MTQSIYTYKHINETSPTQKAIAAEAEGAVKSALLSNPRCCQICVRCQISSLTAIYAYAGVRMILPMFTAESEGREMFFFSVNAYTSVVPVFARPRA